MDEKVKKEQIDYEVEESRPHVDEGCNSGSGNADAEKKNNNAVWAIIAITVIVVAAAVALIFI